MSAWDFNQQIVKCQGIDGIDGALVRQATDLLIARCEALIRSAIATSDVDVLLDAVSQTTGIPDVRPDLQDEARQHAVVTCEAQLKEAAEIGDAATLMSKLVVANKVHNVMQGEVSTEALSQARDALHTMCVDILTAALEGPKVSAATALRQALDQAAAAEEYGAFDKVGVDQEIFDKCTKELEALEKPCACCAIL